ncbi:MAG: DUF1294 domain-containing protein [Oscillospiraceae bacterium]|nr:DUF1294 domain-containing protein [Oscillospiraceae bacterium]
MKILVSALALICCGMSLVLFVTMGFDKRFAQTGRRRVPEKRLFGLAALLGAPGGLLGMYTFRHKTKHWYFVAGFWTLTLLQLGALAYLAYRFM